MRDERTPEEVAVIAEGQTGQGGCFAPTAKYKLRGGSGV